MSAGTSEVASRQRQFCGDPFDPNFLPPQPALGIQTRPTLRQQAPAEREPATAEGVCGQTGQSVTGSLWIACQAADDRQCAPVPRGRECMASALAKKRRPRAGRQRGKNSIRVRREPGREPIEDIQCSPRSCVVALTTQHYCRCPPISGRARRREAVEIRIRKRTKRGDQGELAISFGSLDDLGALLDRLGITER